MMFSLEPTHRALISLKVDSVQSVVVQTATAELMYCALSVRGKEPVVT